MDGHFVPNITMGAPVLSCVKKNVPDIFMDCHMMVSNPAQVSRCVGGEGLPADEEGVCGAESGFRGAEPGFRI